MNSHAIIRIREPRATRQFSTTLKCEIVTSQASGTGLEEKHNKNIYAWPREVFAYPRDNLWCGTRRLAALCDHMAEIRVVTVINLPNAEYIVSVSGQ